MFEPEHFPFDLDETDILDLCDVDRAYRGQLLWRNGAVAEREFDGEALLAVVHDGHQAYEVQIMADEGGLLSICDCPASERHGQDCQHAAAVLYAWLNEADTFLPHDVGDVIALMIQNPALRQAITGDNPVVEQMMDLLQAMPPEARETMTRLPTPRTPDEVQQTVEALAEAAAVREDEFNRQLLASYTLKDLRALARRRGWKLRGTTKGPIVEQLQAYLKDSVPAGELLSGLDEDALAFLRLAYTLFGVVDPLTHEEAGDVWQRTRKRRSQDEVTRALFEHGLLFDCRLHTGEQPHYHWLSYLDRVLLPTVPLSLKHYDDRKADRLNRPPEMMPLFDALPILIQYGQARGYRLRPPRPRHPQADRQSWLRDWEHDVEEVSDLLRRGYGYYVHPNSLLTIPPLRPPIDDETLAGLEVWTGAPAEYLGWLFQVASAFNLISRPPTAGGQVRPDDEQWAGWMAQPPAGQVVAVWRMWYHGLLPATELSLALSRNDRLRLARVAGYDEFTPTELLAEVHAARGFVARLLSSLPGDIWYHWPSFADTVRDLRPAFLHTYWSSPTWGLARSAGRMYDVSKRKEWDTAYRPVLAAFFEGPLYWMGVVELGYRGRELDAFRLTPLGTWLLTGQGQPPALVSRWAEAGPPVTWVDDGTFRLRPGPEAAPLFTVAGAAAEPTDRPLAYRLTATSLERAFVGGLTPDSIAAPFARAGAPLPRPTRARLDDLYRRFGRVHLYDRLTVLELADDLALRELLAGTSLGQHVIHRFSPRLVVVEDSAVDALVEELVKKGYTPRVTSEQA